MIRPVSRRAFLKGLAAGAVTVSASGGLWRTGFSQQGGITAVTNGAVDTMEPTRFNDPNLQLVGNIFDGLLRRDAQGNLLPALATSFERTAIDQWEFTLRQGVRFHNGNAFDAEDVKFSLERLKEDFSEFNFFGSMITEVQILDPFKVRVVTDGSVPFFANNMHQIFILDKESSESRSLEDIAQNPIGTGAYRFVDWVQGDFVDLEANEGYWGGAPAVKRVRHQIIEDDSTRFSALVSGDADLVQNLPTQFASRLDGNQSLRVATREGRQLIFFSPRVVDTPFSDLRVRQAVYHALDSQLIIDTALDGFATPGAQIPDSPTVGHNPDIERLPFDPERARQLLRDAGFPDGFDLTVDVLNDQFVNPVSVGESTAQLLQSIGINAQVRARPGSLFFDDPDKEFFIVGWFDGAFDFGRTAGNLLVTGAFFNDSQYSNPEFDSLIEQANNTLDTGERERLLQRANKLAMDDVALVPLHFEGQVWGVDSGLNFTPRSDSWTLYRDIVPAL